MVFLTRFPVPLSFSRSVHFSAWQKWRRWTVWNVHHRNEPRVQMDRWSAAVRRRIQRKSSEVRNATQQRGNAA